jgi:hypothetical protein
MKSIVRHSIFAAILIYAVLLSVFQVGAVETLPSRLSDGEFWQLVSSLSERSGFFHSNNFVSNERSFQQVLRELAQGRQPGSAYIGVGPEQSFTYLLAVKPKIAFIVDIRRQNLIEHLMYKALFELSADRVEFISRLTSRRRPANLKRDSKVGELFESFSKSSIDGQLFQDNLKAIKTLLIKDHGFALSPEDEGSLELVFRAFSLGGGNLTYDGPVAVRGILTSTGIMPTFEELMLGTDKEGVQRSFLATEENFRTVKQLQEKNLIVPIVGDFAGPSALRAVGKYLRDHDATVTAFYTSNVEQYLFMSGTWQDFYSNVATLPVTGNSVFVRGVIRSASGELSSSPALPLTSRYETLLFSIPDLVADFKKGDIRSYDDIVRGR